MIKHDQHLMIDEDILKSIASNVPKGKILEIGPGKGALTKYLLKDCDEVLAIEKDEFMVYELQKKFKKDLDIKLFLLNANVLNLKLGMYYTHFFVSNLPYSISEPFFYKLVKEGIRECILVTGADFLDKLEGDEKLGIYANVFFEVKKLFNVPKSAFDPQPRVESVCFSLKRNGDSFYQQVLIQLDKKLKNALIKILSEDMTKNEAKKKIADMSLDEDILSKRILHLSNKQFKEFFDKLSKI